MYEVLAGIPSNGNSISLPKFSRSMNLYVYGMAGHMEQKLGLLGYQSLGESAFEAGV